MHVDNNLQTAVSGELKGTSGQMLDVPEVGGDLQGHHAGQNGVVGHWDRSATSALPSQFYGHLELTYHVRLFQARDGISFGVFRFTAVHAQLCMRDHSIVIPVPCSTQSFICEPHKVLQRVCCTE